jgi:hypothetical protein
MLKVLKNYGNILMEAIKDLIVDDLSSVMPTTPSLTNDWVVIPAILLDKLPAHERPEAIRLVRKLERMTAVEYPGQWFQVIIRDPRRGHFRKLPKAKKGQQTFLKDGGV